MSKLEAGSSRGCCYQAASASSADSVEAAASEDKEAVMLPLLWTIDAAVLSSYSECPIKDVPKYFGLSLC